jgi:hypothetical protein
MKGDIVLQFITTGLVIVIVVVLAILGGIIVALAPWLNRLANGYFGNSRHSPSPAPSAGGGGWFWKLGFLGAIIFIVYLGYHGYISRAQDATVGKVYVVDIAHLRNQRTMTLRNDDVIEIKEDPRYFTESILEADSDSYLLFTKIEKDAEGEVTDVSPVGKVYPKSHPNYRVMRMDEVGLSPAEQQYRYTRFVASCGDGEMKVTLTRKKKE